MPMIEQDVQPDDEALMGRAIDRAQHSRLLALDGTSFEGSTGVQDLITPRAKCWNGPGLEPPAGPFT